jgi:hypothetical protein
VESARVLAVFAECAAGRAPGFTAPGTEIPSPVPGAVLGILWNPEGEAVNLIEGMIAFKSQDGESLMAMSTKSALQVVFLRHGGCTFCREALSEIAQRRHAIEAGGTRIVLVHMMDDDMAKELFAVYGLDDVARISDPDRVLYGLFDLGPGKLRQLLGWKVWWRGFVAGILNRHGAGRLHGDGRQMPGVFVVHNGAIVKAFRHDTAADRLDYTTFTGDACRLESPALSRRYLPA